MIERILVVTRETRFEGLLTRFGTRGQAKFHVEQSGGDFQDFVNEHDTYRQAVDAVRRSLDFDVPFQVVDRGLVPTFVFTGSEVIVPVGQDGLVANVARYVAGQPIVAVNPDPERFDGVLLPFQVPDARKGVGDVLRGRHRARQVTLAEAVLHDGQRLTAFNDLFIGANSHVSARYRVYVDGREEPQSSSGVLVTTGAGSTGWMSSVFNMVTGIGTLFGQSACEPVRMEWDDGRLFWAVREPFASHHSGTTLTAGFIEPGGRIEIESAMAAGGVVFGDGVEQDFLTFNAGARAIVRAADERACLVVPRRIAGTT
jgi:hypothetical protein